MIVCPCGRAVESAAGEIKLLPSPVTEPHTSWSGFLCDECWFLVWRLLGKEVP